MGQEGAGGFAATSVRAAARSASPFSLACSTWSRWTWRMNRRAPVTLSPAAWASEGWGERLHPRLGTPTRPQDQAQMVPGEELAPWAVTSILVQQINLPSGDRPVVLPRAACGGKAGGWALQHAQPLPRKPARDPYQSTASQRWRRSSRSGASWGLAGMHQFLSCRLLLVGSPRGQGALLHLASTDLLCFRGGCGAPGPSASLPSRSPAQPRQSSEQATLAFPTPQAEGLWPVLPEGLGLAPHTHSSGSCPSCYKLPQPLLPLQLGPHCTSPFPRPAPSPLPTAPLPDSAFYCPTSILPLQRSPWLMSVLLWGRAGTRAACPPPGRPPCHHIPPALGPAWHPVSVWVSPTPRSSAWCAGVSSPAAPFSGGRFFCHSP